MDNNATPSKWETAVDAVDTLVAQYAGIIRFGLTVFPTVWDDSITDGASCPAGRIDVPVSSGGSAAIPTFLADVSPYGLTPIHGTLSTILADTEASGLGDLDRNNYVLLITDGEETCSVVESGVSTAIQGLAANAPQIRTYVIGFDFADISDNLNCYAHHGGVAREQSCPTLDAVNCSNQSSACYYDAADADALTTAMQAVFTDTISCTYAIDASATDIPRMHIYLVEDNVPTEIARDSTHNDNWDIESDVMYVTFYGTACDDIRSGTAEPQVVIDCIP